MVEDENPAVPPAAVAIEMILVVPEPEIAEPAVALPPNMGVESAALPPTPPNALLSPL
jgi:hypothetical protein